MDPSQVWAVLYEMSEVSQVQGKVLCFFHEGCGVVQVSFGWGTLLWWARRKQGRDDMDFLGGEPVDSLTVEDDAAAQVMVADQFPGRSLCKSRHWECQYPCCMHIPCDQPW